MPYCAACGHSNPDEAKFCTGCGAGLSSNPGSPAVVDSALPVAVAAPEPKRRRVMWIPLAAAAVLLLAGAAYSVWYYNENIKPMDVDEYEETVADLAEDIEGAIDAWESEGFSSSNSSYLDDLADDDVIEAEPYNEMLAEFQDSTDKLREPLIALHDLRAPAEYEGEQETFVRTTDILLAYTDGIARIFEGAPGQTKESYGNYVDDEMEKLEDRIMEMDGSNDMENEFSAALEEVTGETFGY